LELTPSDRNGDQRTIYSRLVRLIRRGVQPFFVLDGPNRPNMKRNKRVGGFAARDQERDLVKVLDVFGLPYMRAPGEAEAQLAYMNANGDIDAVLSVSNPFESSSDRL
jgi:Holliday junction resolvase YEN1